MNNRLMWVLESRGYWPRSSAVFGKNRSTVDHLLQFDSYIRNAFAKKEHVPAIFFDLLKAIRNAFAKKEQHVLAFFFFF